MLSDCQFPSHIPRSRLSPVAIFPPMSKSAIWQGVSPCIAELQANYRKPVLRARRLKAYKRTATKNKDVWTDRAIVFVATFAGERTTGVVARLHWAVRTSGNPNELAPQVWWPMDQPHRWFLLHMRNYQRYILAGASHRQVSAGANFRRLPWRRLPCYRPQWRTTQVGAWPSDVFHQ